MRRDLALVVALTAGPLGVAAPPAGSPPAAHAGPRQVAVAFRGISAAVTPLPTADTLDLARQSHRRPGSDDSSARTAGDEHGRRYGTRTPRGRYQAHHLLRSL